MEESAVAEQENGPTVGWIGLGIMGGPMCRWRGEAARQNGTGAAAGPQQARDVDRQMISSTWS